ncbi:hypothetical protein DNTS_005897 [Danionella cerebrum]|uniref:PH domain-containing protein n=1 Tax=Danionella cerebrum TaxID=2873325 RepID=A0A553R8Z4_9TELE|nr:hypothetical protein DNTS_005897 [Danionella translucida]
MEDQTGSASNSPLHGSASGRSDVLRCGWLRKQGGFVKTWHSRWFVLRGDQLHYYKDEDETKALKSGYLKACQATQHKSYSISKEHREEGIKGYLEQFLATSVPTPCTERGL